MLADESCNRCMTGVLPLSRPGVALTVTLDAADRLALLRRLREHSTGTPGRRLPEALAAPILCVPGVRRAGTRPRASAIRPGPMGAADPG